MNYDMWSKPPNSVRSSTKRMIHKTDQKSQEDSRVYDGGDKNNSYGVTKIGKTYFRNEFITVSGKNRNQTVKTFQARMCSVSR